MAWNEKDFNTEIRGLIDSYDRQGVEEACARLIEHLRGRQNEYPQEDAETILKNLRKNRYFDLMQKVADTMINGGQDAHSIRIFYAQSLLDQSILTGALSVLDAMASDEKAGGEEKERKKHQQESRGLIGRGYKQIYIDTYDPAASSPSIPRNQQNLMKAIAEYRKVFDENFKENPKECLWHGVNAVALLCRAERDGISLPDYRRPGNTARGLAQEILDQVEELYNNDDAKSWDYATAAEACVALDRDADALTWIQRYVKDSKIDAFQMASTLRQFTEVWQLDINSKVGSMLLPILTSVTLGKDGGNVTLTPKYVSTAESNWDKTQLEKVFGKESFQTVEWFQKALERCRAIARIGFEISRGEGTGFLLRGADLHSSLGEGFYLLTNAHVIPETVSVTEAVISFQALNDKLAIKGEKIIWSSPVNHLDATLIQLKLDEEAASLFKQCVPYPIAERPPNLEENQRVYIIGHPSGGTLSFSLQDNLLFDHDFAQGGAKLHYRTPTEGGSSGSPVFNRQWTLIGLHHAGKKNMRMLNGKPDTYEANEGLWIGAIIAELGKFLDEKGSVAP